MSAEFAPIRNQNISDTIATRIRIEILRGTYAPGDRLPSERELALSFGVNRVSVREALLKLSGLGLVSIKQGTGVTVLDYRTAGQLPLLVSIINTPDEDGRYDGRVIANLVEMARPLYRLAVELCVSRMTADEHAALCDTISRQLALADDIEAFTDNNLAMQDAIFDASHNIALRLLYNTVREVLVDHASPFRQIFQRELSHGDTRARILAWYQLALDALRARDAEALKRLMETAFNPKNRRLVVEFFETQTF